MPGFEPSIARRIEGWVQSRNFDLARREIMRVARRLPADSPDILMACDWLRRLGFFRDAFSLFRIKELRISGSDCATPDGRQALWAARLLNSMGDSLTALRFARRIRGRTTDDFRILGNIFLSNLALDEAEHYLGRMKKAGPANPGDTHLYDMGLIALADCRAWMGRFDEALSLSRMVHARANSRILQGISLQSQAEALAMAGEFVQARALLDEAENHLPSGELGLDRALLLKWRAYVLGKLGRTEEARSHFDLALDTLRRPGYRPETWMHLLHLRREVIGISPEDDARLRHFPGLSDEFRAFFGGPYNASFGDPRAELELWPLRNEWHADGKGWRIGFPKELRLAAWVSVAGAYGVPWVRLAPLIWEGESLELAQLELRLKQLLTRLRHLYGISIRLREQTLYLESGESHRTLRVGIDGSTIPHFLDEEREFRAAEMASHYGLRSSRASEVLKEWRERGWITALGAGRSTRYRRG